MKKFFVFAAALMMGTSMFAELPHAPSDEDLEIYRDPDQNLVYVFYAEGDAYPCNDVILVGTYNDWSTAVEGCAHFEEVEGYENWFVCCVKDTSKNIQAKPVQKTKPGGFNWIHQIGADAELIRGTATIVPGSNNECDIKDISDAAPLLIQVHSWKQDPCLCYNYIITFISPDCNEKEYITPAISGDFNGWAQDSMTIDGDATNARQLQTLPGAVYRDTIYAAEGSEYKFRSAESWGEKWTNELREFNNETSEWQAFNGGNNFTFGKSLEIEFDLGDPTLHSWTNCERPIVSNLGNVMKEKTAKMAKKAIIDGRMVIILENDKKLNILGAEEK